MFYNIKKVVLFLKLRKTLIFQWLSKFQVESCIFSKQTQHEIKIQCAGEKGSIFWENYWERPVGRSTVNRVLGCG